MLTPQQLRRVALHGTTKPEPAARVLKAGPISAVFVGGAIRHIRHGQHEVLRGIAYLARDVNWATYEPVFSRLKVDESWDRFVITYHAKCGDQRQSLDYDARIEARATGELTFTVTAVPPRDFITNRTGFVVLHPLEGVVGAAVDVVHTDGSKRRRRFPKMISPGQPIFDIRALTHTVAPGLSATVLMEGNTFEMEDQRNWMDASYKTYVCSLLDPWPYTLAKGEAFTQRVTLTVRGKAKAVRRAVADATVVSVGKAAGKMPAVGIAIPMGEAERSLASADLIRLVEPSHLVCQIDGREGGQGAAARAFRALSDAVGAPVTLEVILPAELSAHAEMKSISEAVQGAGLLPSKVVVTQQHDLKSFQPNTERPWGPSYEEMAKAARAFFPAASIGGGVLSYFTELNRKPVPPGVFDFVTHSICPVVHAADSVSVMETLESLPHIFWSARRIVGAAPYHLGPSSIACRNNPYGETVTDNPDSGRYCLTDDDPRQRGLFGAAWYLGVLSAAANAKLNSVTLCAATGAQGLIGAQGQMWPAFHVIANLARAAGSLHMKAVSASPSRVAALAYATQHGPALWLANLTGKTQQVKIRGLRGAAQTHKLASRNFLSACSDKRWFERKGKVLDASSLVEIEAYAIVRVSCCR